MKEQPSFNETNITNLSMTNQDRTIPSIAVNKSQLIKGDSSLLKQFIIITIVFILMGIICIIIVFSVKNNRNKNKPKNPIIFQEPTSSSSNSPNSSSSSASSPSSFPSLPDDLPFSDRYKEAEELLESKEIKDNHNILNENYKYISDSIVDSKDTRNNLKPISTSTSYTIPDFLNDPTDNSLKTVKNDINLYNSKYKELTENANNLTRKVYEQMNNLTEKLENIKEGEYRMFEDFENKTINYSFPLTLFNSTGDNDDNKTSLLNETIQQYKDEISKLNSNYNNFFNYIKGILPVISINMKEIPNSVKDTNNNIEKSISEYGNILGKFKKESSNQEMHENLILMKQSFLNIKNNMTQKKETITQRKILLEEVYKNNTFDLEKFQNETDKISENINHIQDSIIKEINNERTKKGYEPIVITNPTVSSLNTYSIVQSIYRIFEILINIEILKENEITSIINLINVEETTSLDLLFIMDLTGSMGPYVEQAKANIIDIINRIINGCPGIDINIGFIGYRDEYEETHEDVVDIEFTKEHEQLKNQIRYVYAKGGGDFPEDVAWGFEKALNKLWKNNARFIVFVADAPNHGAKYGGGSYTIPGRKDLESLIRELANNGVSLFCMEIDEYNTRTMFNVFENVYKNYKELKFQIVPMDSANSFANVVVEAAIDVYENQRMIIKKIKN